MSADRENAITPIGLGFRALKGGSVVVGVAIDGREPRLVLSTFLATAAKGDLSLEPYQIAAEMGRGPHGAIPAETSAAVAEGRNRQGELAVEGLDGIVRKLREARCETVVAALLINRAGLDPRPP